METTKNVFAKQCDGQQKIFSHEQCMPISDPLEQTVTYEVQDEPIDLTFTKVENNENLIIKKENIDLTECTQSDFAIETNRVNLGGRRHSKRKFVSTYDGNLVLVEGSNIPNIRNATSGSYPTALESKQIEIIKAAKSLFSKRTRTLYHWMYPNASKQQINYAVANSWETLGIQEKDLYVSQVMGRLGYSQENLMVNPQLGNIKELPPLPNIQDFNAKAHELQNAISSISYAPVPSSNSLEDTDNFEENYNSCKSRKRGRPSGSKGKKKPTNEFVEVGQDFQDDPELSQELAQFAIMIKDKIE